MMDRVTRDCPEFSALLKKGIVPIKAQVLCSGIPAPQSVASGSLTLPYGDSVCSMHMNLIVRPSLPYDLVLGRDWLFFCRQTLPHASFTLSSGVVTPGMPSSSSTRPLFNAPLAASGHGVFCPDDPPRNAPGRNCTCSTPSACQCPSTSAIPSSMTTSDCSMTSLNIIRDILFGHHTTRSRISVFHADLLMIQRSLELHAVPHAGMTLLQCRRVLLHHITTGACADHAVDASVSPRPDRSACRALCQDFECAADMSKAVLNLVLGADHKQISTESLSHVAAALNISVPGVRNLRFKLRAALKKHVDTISTASTELRSSASVADFFNSFESHRRPILLSIAALHRIQVPDKSSVDWLRSKITEHILSGDCTQFSQPHPPISLPNGLGVPDCTVDQETDMEPWSKVICQESARSLDSDNDLEGQRHGRHSARGRSVFWNYC
ncbi:hypothetical protein B0H11DRAFT_2205761 [Mycena galericulata]|nr:hypothetical protein B0H11DRAFT_2205761 [Mycena galericulata]